jgi:hypothetical protein
VNFGAIGGVISLITTFLFAIGGLVTIRARRLSKEASELRELREMNVAAMRYIYDLEMAADEAARLAGVKLNLVKPDLLKRSFIEAKVESTNNSELDQVLAVMKAFQQQQPPNSALGGKT